MVRSAVQELVRVKFASDGNVQKVILDGILRAHLDNQ